MKFRVSQYTPYLLISLAITMIIRYFFDPLQLPSETYTLWDIKNNTVVNMDMDAFQTMVMGNVMNKIIHLLCPILSEISDWLKYFYGIMDDRGAIIIASEIMMVGYVIFTYFLEKFHAYWHNEESCFAVCCYNCFMIITWNCSIKQSIKFIVTKISIDSVSFDFLNFSLKSSYRRY